jgi:large subunit ribosomal protein L23
MKPKHKSELLLGIHFSEKANRIADNNQRVFIVRTSAKKLEIKKAVQEVFDVDVKDVKTILVKGKTKRNKFGKGRCADFKKAYVTLGQGQEINLAERNEEKSK